MDRIGRGTPCLLIVLSSITAPDLVQNVARPENTKEWLEITRLKSSGVLNETHSFFPERILPRLKALPLVAGPFLLPKIANTEGATRLRGNITSANITRRVF
jgi:hypothetical protein